MAGATDDRRSTTASPRGASAPKSRSTPITTRPWSGPIGWWRRTSASNRRRPVEGARRRPSSSARRFGSRRGVQPDVSRAVERCTLRQHRRQPRGVVRLERWTSDRIALEAADQGLGRRVEPGDDPVVPERPSVQWVDDRASAGSDHRSGLSAGLGDGRRLGLAERRLAVRAQIVGHGRAVNALEDRIGVDERAVEPLGDLATDGRLAASRHADQHDARSRLRHRSRAPRRAHRA